MLSRDFCSISTVSTGLALAMPEHVDSRTKVCEPNFGWFLTESEGSEMRMPDGACRLDNVHVVNLQTPSLMV